MRARRAPEGVPPNAAPFDEVIHSAIAPITPSASSASTARPIQRSTRPRLLAISAGFASNETSALEPVAQLAAHDLGRALQVRDGARAAQQHHAAQLEQHAID